MPAWRLHKAFNRRGGRVTVNGLLDGNLLIPQFAWMKAPFIHLSLLNPPLALLHTVFLLYSLKCFSNLTVGLISLISH